MKSGLGVLAKLTTSALKIEILETLHESRDLNELSECLKKPKQTLVPHLKSLMELDFVEKADKGYVITISGKLAYEKILEIVKLFEVLKKFGNFLKEHDTSPIPESLLKEVWMLHDGKVVVKENPYEFHEEWIEILFDSEWIRGLSSIYHPNFPELFLELSRGRDVKLILTEKVFEKVKRDVPEKLQEFLSRGEIFVCDNVRLTFIVAEKGFTMNLYRNSYDASQMLICRSEKAVEWGLKLFNHYLARSRKVER